MRPIRGAVPIALSVGLLLTGGLYFVAQIIHRSWAERIVGPFALAGFAVNVHQGNLVVTMLMMFLGFSLVTWVIVEGLRLERRRRLREER